MEEKLGEEEMKMSVTQWQSTAVCTTPSGLPQKCALCNSMTPNSGLSSSCEKGHVVRENTTLPGSSHDTPAPISSSIPNCTMRRITFLEDLASVSTTPPAVIFQFPISNVTSVEQEAKSMGFYTRIIDDGHGGASLVLGRAKEAVEGLSNPGNHKGKVGQHNGGGEISEGTAVEVVATLARPALC
jgi:hypothetical protein